MHIILYANANTKVRSPGESYGLWCNTGFHRNIIKFSATCVLQIRRFDLSVIQPPIALVKPLTGWVWLAVMRSEKWAANDILTADESVENGGDGEKAWCREGERCRDVELTLDLTTSAHPTSPLSNICPILPIVILMIVMMIMSRCHLPNRQWCPWSTLWSLFAWSGLQFWQCWSRKGLIWSGLQLWQLLSRMMMLGFNFWSCLLVWQLILFSPYLIGHI